MKIKNIFLALIILFITANIYGKTLTKLQRKEAKKTFKIANDFYKNKEFDNALKIYQEFLNQGIKTKEIYYNIGCIYFNLENYPKARYYFEKALMLDYNNEKIRENLELTIKKLKLDRNLIGDDSFRILKKIIYIFNIKILHYVNILLLIIFTIALYLFIIKGRIERKHFIIISAIIIILLILATTIIRARNYLENLDIIVIEKDGEIIRSAPSEEFDVVFRSKAGQKAYIKSREGEWAELEFENNWHGWYKYEDI